MNYDTTPCLTYFSIITHLLHLVNLTLVFQRLGEERFIQMLPEGQQFLNETARYDNCYALAISLSLVTHLYLRTVIFQIALSTNGNTLFDLSPTQSPTHPFTQSPTHPPTFNPQVFLQTRRRDRNTGTHRGSRRARARPGGLNFRQREGL